MAREFERTNSEYLSNGSPLLTAAPMTVSMWINPFLPMSGGQTVFSIADTGGNDDFFILEYLGGSPADIRWMAVRGSGGIASIPNVIVPNQWQHVCGVEVASNLRHVYYNGGSEATNTDSRVPVSLDNTTIAAHLLSVLITTPNVRVGHAALWNVALTAAEVASLAAGVSPLRIRRDNLVEYWPINGQSPERGVVGGFNMTVNGTPAVVEEPPTLIGNHIVAPG